MDTFMRNLANEPDEEGFMPAMKVYLLEKNEEEGVRPMVIICPGGGYSCVVENWEGERIAMAYAAAGFHTAVVDYKVAPRDYRQPLRDAAAAVRTCRENAGIWQVDPAKIIICGFSAGGHLAASVSTLWDSAEFFTPEEIGSRICRPDASILCYPVITSGDKAHKDSFVKLIGSDDEGLPEWREMSLEYQVDDQTPPAFLWHTVEDSVVPVENSMYYATALREHHVPFELYIYPRGDHGLSLVTQGLSRTKPMFGRDYGWMKLSIDWINELFGLCQA